MAASSSAAPAPTNTEGQINTTAAAPTRRRAAARSRLPIFFFLFSFSIALVAFFWPSNPHENHSQNNPTQSDMYSACPFADELGLNDPSRWPSLHSASVDSSDVSSSSGLDKIPHKILPGQNPENCPVMRQRMAEAEKREGEALKADSDAVASETVEPSPALAVPSTGGAGLS